MLLEIYAQSIDATAFYSVYLTLLISMSISAFWLSNSTSYLDSSIIQFYLKPSVSESVYKMKADLGARFHLQILKRVKIKIDPGEDKPYFSPL